MVELIFKNSSGLKLVNYFRKKLHYRCLTGPQIRLFDCILKTSIFVFSHLLITYIGIIHLVHAQHFPKK